MTNLEQQARRYAVTILPDADEGFIARIPDFPRVYTNGDTPEEALANAYEAIALSLAWYVEQGQPMPTPSASALAA
ncbi:MAG: type II toxin-antitoxin system HicB family antitoxin [Armatimonadetes bacterium]|nr:type II toxin-antitoxin system HicB family antitoxin [Armatimonadota bacterium]